jgi:pyrimidine dimer DNA glycosylase
MRLWTLHPRYLDSKGLVAAWREALLAQKVLSGKTTGYRNHPQLIRFRAQADPMGAIATFLAGLAEEAGSRGYHFDSSKIDRRRLSRRIPETKGQLMFEWKHLGSKLRKRAPALSRLMKKIKAPDPHPMFRLVPGGVREWEKF